MQYSELFFYFIRFILTETYEPVLPYHITVSPKTEMWHITNTTIMLARPSGAPYSFHTATQWGSKFKTHSLKLMAEFLEINSSYICTMEQGSVATAVAMVSKEWGDIKNTWRD
jgi:hypothetical protein